MYKTYYYNAKQSAINIYSKRYHIIIAVLATVILWQNFSYLLPTFDLGETIEVHNVEAKEEPCDYVCLTRVWVELRTEEIMEEGMDNYRIESRTKALLEANAMLTEI